VLKVAYKAKDAPFSGAISVLGPNSAHLFLKKMRHFGYPENGASFCHFWTKIHQILDVSNVAIGP